MRRCILASMSEDKKAEALAFLRNHTAGVLATCGTDGVPHASAVFYVADAKFNLHFITLMNSRKYKALKENPRVAFTVGTQDVPQTIQIEGIAEEILTSREKNMESARLIDVLMQNSTRYYAPLTKMDKARLVLVWIQPTWIRWADYTNKEAAGNENVWTEFSAQ